MKDLFAKTDLGKKLENIKKLKSAQLWIDSMDRDIQLLVVELNRMQLQKGFDSNDEELRNIITGRKKYQLATQIIYSEIGRYIQAGGHYTMKHTSKFFNSIHVSEILNDGFEIDADGQKENVNIFDIYGNKIIGLSEGSLDILKDKLRIKMLNKCREYITQA
jgi:hypothetical protein